MMGHHDPIAYTYDASEHCQDCAEDRFGRSPDGFIAEDAVDAEGNPVGAVFEWDEWDRDMTCGTCGTVIRECHGYEDYGFPFTRAAYLACVDWHGGQGSDGYRLQYRLADRLALHGVPAPEYLSDLMEDERRIYTALGESHGVRL